MKDYEILIVKCSWNMESGDYIGIYVIIISYGWNVTPLIAREFDCVFVWTCIMHDAVKDLWISNLWSSL